MSDHEKLEILRAICGGNLGLAREMADGFMRSEEKEEEPKRVAPSIYDHRKSNALHIERGARF